MTATAAPRASLGGLRRSVGRVAALLVTPLVPADYVALLDPLRSSAELCARVVEVRPETRDAVTLVLRPGRGWRGHVPGQYVRLGVDVDGVRHWRPYSLTSEPGRRDGCIAVAVTAVPGGVVSTHLVRRLQPGAVVRLDQPLGGFVLPDPAPSKVLFVTAGSGVTPVVGMLRSHLDALDDVVVVHAARTPADALFGGELRALARAGRIRFLERHTAVEGRLTAADLERLVPDLADRDAWACGPNGLLDALEAHWGARGIRPRLRTERFRPALTAVAEGGTVRFVGSGIDVEADGTTSLLDAGEAAGVAMPSGCRMGICFGCVTPLREGAVRDLRNGALTTAAPGDGVLVQTCISAAAGPCELER